MTRHGTLFVLSSLLAVSCSSEPVRSGDQPGDAASPSAQDAAGKGGVASAPAAASPGALTGTVIESMDAAQYTYMRLQTANGEAWAAVNRASVEKGDSVTIVDATLMEGFESRTLNRTFDRIWFGRLSSGAVPPAAAAETSAAGGSVPPAMLAALAAQHAGAASGSADSAPIQVARAEGAAGRTIAEIYANKASLRDQQVTVRGKVVKYNPGIMGRNWVHIRDGSGSPEAKDNDLTLTTSDVVVVGDVVLVSGRVHLDRDFGAGYSYPVIIEDAKIAK